MKKDVKRFLYKRKNIQNLFNFLGKERFKGANNSNRRIQPQSTRAALRSSTGAVDAKHLMDEGSRDAENRTPLDFMSNFKVKLL